MNSNHPNILFVFSDQQRYSALGANGNDVIQTPFLDKLASEGLACDRMYSNHPLCSPFRAILLTGQFGWRNRVIDNEYCPRKDIPTLPGILKKNRYKTGHIGTFHLGKGPYRKDDRYGYDYLMAQHSGNGYFDNSYFENESGPKTTKGWGPQVETDSAIEFITRHSESNSDDPFALFLSWRPPHWPYESYPEEYRVHDPESIVVPDNVPDQMKEFSSAEIAQYYDMCTGLDAQMGRLLETLSKLKIKDNTIIIYTSDHGDHLSSHGYGKPRDKWMHHSMRASKATPYEESIHVPFIISWPNRIPYNKRSKAFMSSIDIAPSLLGACGITTPGDFQGRNISSIWRNEPLPIELHNEQENLESAYLINMANGWPDRNGWVGRWRAVRTERYTYARWFGNEYDPLLFDNLVDPLQQTNIFTSLDSQSTVEELESLLHQWMEKTKDPFEFGQRGPRGFINIGQKWADEEKWSAWSTT